nr:MAG TPA: hypothetical protein [Caudoviricetes sp.]
MLNIYRSKLNQIKSLLLNCFICRQNKVQMEIMFQELRQVVLD